MVKSKTNYSCREFLAGAGVLVVGTSLQFKGIALITEIKKKEPIIDIHQNIHYLKRIDEQVLSHQRAMAGTTTILLPAGRPVDSPSTHEEVANGLQADAGGHHDKLIYDCDCPNLNGLASLGCRGL